MRIVTLLRSAGHKKGKRISLDSKNRTQHPRVESIIARQGREAMPRQKRSSIDKGIAMIESRSPTRLGHERNEKSLNESNKTTAGEIDALIQRGGQYA